LDAAEDRSHALARSLLAAIRLINGVLALLLPRLPARRLGVNADTNPALLYFLHMS
jgi:hypothetical protein